MFRFHGTRLLSGPRTWFSIPRKFGYFVGIVEHVGHAMTFKILTDDTKRVIYRSNVHSGKDPKSSNLRMDPLVGDPVDGDQDTHDLVGRTFLMDERKDGQHHRARIVQAIADHASDLAANPTRIKFVCSINDEQFEEILTYNEVLHHIEQNEDDAVVWKFRRITAHEGPLQQSDRNWKGSSFNVMV
jgi:hypothetical protein